jgi:hypothetical protein
MGNRVLIQFTNGTDFSPVLYGHWHGDATAETLRLLRAQMEGRATDIQYVAARCVEVMTRDSRGGQLSFGIWNAKGVLTDDDSHGNAGIYLVDISDNAWKVLVFAGSPSERGKHTKAPGISFKVLP